MSYYGNLDDVAALVPRIATSGGLFSATTRPTDAQVSVWLDQVSAQVDVVLANEGFVAPVTQTTVVSAISGFVDQEVAAMCEGVNGSGRFGPTAKAPHNKGRLSLWALVVEDIEAFIGSNANGFEALGATRTGERFSGIYSRSYDDDGLAVEPLFQRQMFGEMYRVWSSSSE